MSGGPIAARKILVLEDDVAVGSIYATVLRSPETEVVVCTRFEDARAEIARSMPDAVLTDVRVGEFNGLQLAILFRSFSPKGMILVVSGHDDPVIRKEVANLGAEFLVKPIDLTRLRQYFFGEVAPS